MRLEQRLLAGVEQAIVPYFHQWKPTDMVVWDNWRMLHARTSFTGSRWLRGVYFDRA